MSISRPAGGSIPSGADQITFRYATISDVPRFLALFKQVVSSVPYYNEAARQGEIARCGAQYTISEMSRNERALSLAYSPQDELLGFCICQEQNGPIWLEWYGVRDDARGRGVGEALVRWVCAEAAANGATKIWCATRTNNAPSASLFRKLEFQALCLMKNHWYGEDYTLWEKPFR
jgi:ribosomal protein S18 acetylase RimI-like enzyme